MPLIRGCASKDRSANADVWRFRHSWAQEKERLREELLTGTYEVGLLNRVTLDGGGEQADIDLWSARDALVMKGLSMYLTQAMKAEFYVRSKKLATIKLPLLYR